MPCKSHLGNGLVALPATLFFTKNTLEYSENNKGINNKTQIPE